MNSKLWFGAPSFPVPMDYVRLLDRTGEQVTDLATYFNELNARYGRSLESNARYMVQQAEGYEKALLAYIEAAVRGVETAERNAYFANARSELSRIFALVARECVNHNWSIFDVLREGLEYEYAVRDDIISGRRKPDSHKGFGE